MKRIQIITKGRVQGVGFRMYVQQMANSHSLTGWVKNLDSGAVEINAQGDETALSLFESKLLTGNRFIRVDTIEKQELSPLKNENGFQIRYY